MKKTLFFAFLFPCLYNGNAQSFSEIHWTEPVEPTHYQHLQGMYGNNDLTFAVATDRDHGFDGLSIIGSDAVGKVWKVDYSLKESAHSLVGAYAQKSEVVIILENQHEKNGQFVQEVKSLHFNTAGFTSEETLLTSESKNKHHLGKMKFSVSPDRKKCVVFAESPFKAGANEEIRTILFDEDGKAENATFSLDIESKQVVHNYPQLANSGLIYFLKRDKDKSQQFHYFLYSYNPLTNDLSHRAIALSNTNISDFRGVVTPQGEFLVGGFTSSENIHAYEGYFLMKFDQACNPKFKTQGQFDEGTFLKFLSKKEYSKNPVITNYFIDNITLSPSGRIYLAAEAYDEKKVSEKESVYNYRDIMLVCFTEMGDYYSTYKVDKDQNAGETAVKWASYKTFFYSDTLVVLHNALTAKEPSPKFRQTKVHDKFGPVPVPAQLNFDQPDQSMVFNPDLFLQEDNRHFTAVFSSPDRRRFRLVRVTL